MPKTTEIIPETDQWKLDGRCSVCRRVKYCHKECSALKRGIEQIVSGFVRDSIRGLFPDIPNSRY
jgi:hypothetical protein